MIRLEKDLVNIASRLIKIDDFDEAIGYVLEHACIMLGTKRSYLFKISEDEKIIDNTHEYIAEGIASHKKNSQGLKFSEFTCLMKNLRRNEIISIHNVSEMPESTRAEREILQKRGTYSALIIPMYMEGKLYGFLGSDETDSLHRWEPVEILALKNLTENFSKAVEHMKVDEALQRSEEKYRTMIENSKISYGILQDDSVKYANQSAVKLFGYSLEEMLSDDFNFMEQLFPPEVRETVRKNLNSRLKGENIPDYELRMWNKNRNTVYVTIRASVIEYEEKQAYEIQLLDITDRKRTEDALKESQEQLFQVQKMEALGRLAGGVAHDFNNLLTGILGYSDLILMRFEDDEQICTDVEQIKKAAHRAASLTRQILAFSRKQMLKPEVLNLNVLVEDTGKMLKRLIGEDIELAIVLDSSLERVRADPGQIDQVIMNLTVNARDAMREGGELTIKTENVIIDQQNIKTIPFARPGKFVCLSVADTGIGMDKATVDRIFEPFFTTKKSEEGTGLGLSTVYGIIKQHEGWINVYSKPGFGSTFKAYLQAFSIGTEGLSEKAISLKELQGNAERILLVEDEEGILTFAARALRQNGYVVFEAENAEDAINIFEREREDLHLVFSDVILPGKSGLQLVDQLLSRKPQVRVLLTTGYTDQKSQWPVIRERGFKVLQKPYALQDLLRAIRAAIEPQ